MSDLQKRSQIAKVKCIIQSAIGVFLILFALQQQAQWSTWIVVAMICYLFFRIAYINYRNIGIYSSYISNFNDNNDGIFHHFLRIKPGDEYEIYIDQPNRKIRLKSGLRDKTFDFEEIKGMTYTVADKVGASDSVFTRAAEATDKMNETGLDVFTFELKNPSWRIKFIDENGPANSKSPRFFW